MFVITLVPSSDARGNIGKSLENFRYLGGGDFTGRVFCSTLEGEFVKAFGYTDGRLSVPFAGHEANRISQTCRRGAV